MSPREMRYRLTSGPDDFSEGEEVPPNVVQLFQDFRVRLGENAFFDGRIDYRVKVHSCSPFADRCATAASAMPIMTTAIENARPGYVTYIPTT